MAAEYKMPRKISRVYIDLPFRLVDCNSKKLTTKNRCILSQISSKNLPILPQLNCIWQAIHCKILVARATAMSLPANFLAAHPRPLEDN